MIMEYLSELASILKQFLFWDKRRMMCFTSILRALFTVKTVNLTEIATTLPGPGKLESKYKRLQRFFRFFDFDISIITRIIINLIPLEKEKIILSIDRTNWKLGKYNINILFLALYYKGYAIPLAWTVMNCKGSSNTAIRIELLKKVLNILEPSQIKAFLADREFIGEEWIQFLYQNCIPFYIRLKKDLMVRFKGQPHQVSVGSIFHNIKKQPKYYEKKFEFCSCELYLSGRRTHDGDLMIIVTNDNSHKSFQMYRMRWSIENLFGCLKTRGFRLEETHLTKIERLSKLIFVLTFAFLLAIRRGVLKKKEERIRIKKHGRFEKSLFRKGLDIIRSFFLDGSLASKEFKIILRILKPRKRLEIAFGGYS